MRERRRSRRTEQALADSDLEYAFYDRRRPRFHWSRAVLPRLREIRVRDYVMEDVAGDLEVWKRR